MEAVARLNRDAWGWIYQPFMRRPDLGTLIAFELAGGHVYYLDGTSRSIRREHKALASQFKAARTAPGFIAVGREEMLISALTTIGA